MTEMNKTDQPYIWVYIEGKKKIIELKQRIEAHILIARPHIAYSLSVMGQHSKRRIFTLVIASVN